MARWVPGSLRHWIFFTFGTARVVGHQPYAPAAFTPGEIPGTHFQRPQGTWFRREEPQKKSPVTPPGIDPGTVRLVAQYLNHYTTPGPVLNVILCNILKELQMVFLFMTQKLRAGNNITFCFLDRAFSIMETKK